MKQAIHCFIILLTLFLWVPNSYADGSFKPSIKDQNWVNDRAYVISSKTEYMLTQRSMQYEQEIGAQIITATVNSLRSQNIENFSTSLVTEWNLPKNENTVLFLIAPKEKKVLIKAGLEFQNILNTINTADIIENTIMPSFDAGEIEKGIIYGHRSIINKLNGVDVRHDRSSIEKMIDVIMFVFIFPFLIYKGFKHRHIITNIHPALRGEGRSNKSSSRKW